MPSILDTGAIVSVTVQDADDGDTTTAVRDCLMRPSGSRLCDPRATLTGSRRQELSQQPVARGLEAMSVRSIANVPNPIIPEERLTAYFLYYLAKASFSFRAPAHKNHPDERRCPYDQKVNKLAIIESMRASRALR